MKRRIFRIVSAMSLLLCLSCLAMWVWSGLWSDNLIVYGVGRTSAFTSECGNLTLWTESRRPPALREDAWVWQVFPKSQTWYLNWPRYQASTATRNSSVFSERSLRLPYWMLTLATGIVPGLWLRSWWSCYGVRKRRHAGRCEMCGYDLRATPHRCPEYGTPALTQPPSGSTRT